MPDDNYDQRYSCQMALPGFGRKAQEALSAARILITGIGGLGCPAAQYLAASGVGTIGLADADRVSVSNLHRQILFGPEDTGQLKVEVARERLLQQNPLIKVEVHAVRVDISNVESILQQYDLVLDCTDNFETRYLLNDAAVLANKPLIYGAIYQFEGQVSVWNYLHEDGTRSANFRDLFPKVDASQVPNCSVGGVIPTLAGIIGCMQANEAIKVITGSEDIMAGQLLLFDAQTMRSRLIKIPVKSGVVIEKLTAAKEVPLISANALADNLLLVDVREPEERAKVSLGGLHIPLRELAERLEEIPSEGALVFYCASGKRSAEAVRIAMAKFPDRKLFSLENGINPVNNISLHKQ
jgi:molybdopterin/thiamine biosynthesis adenylyltransferase/rhodanese-related sulfurtransferase